MVNRKTRLLIAMTGHPCSVPYIPAVFQGQYFPGEHLATVEIVGFAVKSLWAEVRDIGSASDKG